MTFEEIIEKYEVVEPEDIRHDYNGMHHMGIDVVDENNEVWGVFAKDEDEYVLAR